MMGTDAARTSHAPEAPDRYVLLERIGAGGAGIVYRARDEVSGRLVAFKQLVTAKLGGRAKTLAALFEREYRTLVRLKHPRIIEVYEYGISSEGPYYTMELLEGSDLRELRALPYADVCRHLRDVASSLALLHSQRLVHRDVSPGNIRLTADGTARLLDFGALASFGTNTEVIGTPPFMAPEILHQSPLDARTDVYSLGAVGYFCLTGRPPFPARDVNDLPRLWATPPAPPSAHSPDVPPELDRLILSMLTLDPLGRPETAAAVMDQLTVIGRLAPEPHERAEQSYFLSSPLVGRATQMEWVTTRIDQALGGKGGAVVLEGAAGIGKTRVANELCLAATLKGALSLRADAEATCTSFAVAATLARKLFEACPDVARRAAAPHASVLANLAPELADVLGGTASGILTTDLNERRAGYHRVLRELFLSVSRECALLVCVDNIHAADDDSASFLVMLGRESRASRLFVLTTLRTGVKPSAPEAIRILRERAQRLRLSALDATACELLANGLFGGAANAGRVGGLLADRSGGVPRQFIELAQLMVQKKIAKYEAGSWVLPLDVAKDELPAGSEEVLTARLSELGVDAVRLAQALAVHAGSIPLAVALAVSDLAGEGRTYAVLDELIAEEVLVSGGDGYRFRHEALRQAVLSRTAPDVYRASRLRAAEALLAFDASSVAQRVEAALHLIDAGDDDRGTRILVAAAREYAAGAGSYQNSDQLVSALCDRVRVYDQEGRSDYVLAAVLFPLMPLAYYAANWQFILEYGERAIEIGMRITGLQKAAELASELGPEEALKRGLGAAAASFAQQGDVAFDLKSAVAATIGMTAACVGTYATCFDTEAVMRIAHAAKALALFGEQHMAYVMHQFVIGELLIMGSESQARAPFGRALARLDDPASISTLGETRARILKGGLLFALGLLDAYRFGDTGLEAAARLEALGVKTWAVVADQIRILYHSLRGEVVEAKTYMERVELNAVHGAQTWQAELFWPALLLNADVLASDAMGARRRYVQLDRRAKDAPSLEPYAAAARAAYLLLRGEFSEAISLYEAVLPMFPPRQRAAWETTRAAFARALNAVGAHERARAVAEEVLTNMLPGDAEHVTHFLEAERQRALAESGLGNHARAMSLLDALLAQHGHQTNDLLVGLLHQARADVAERAGDRAAADAHRGEARARFHRTRNPTLIAQSESAARRAASASGPRVDGERHQPMPTTIATLTNTQVGAQRPASGTPVSVADVANASDEPLDSAVDLVMRQTKSQNAYLYLCTDQGLKLAYSSTNDEAPAACVAELGRWLNVVRENHRDDGALGGTSMSTVHTVTSADYRLVVLCGANEDNILGGLVLERQRQVDFVGSTDLFEALGRVVEEHGAEALEFITA